jgi:hypothetical protein
MKRVYKIILVAVFSIALLLFITILFSPYGLHDRDAHRSVKTSIVIDASADRIFSYLGNSANAAKWSVYVHHITPMNDSIVKDGMPGCIRRCFTQADEQGIVWDELTTVVIPNRKRQLDIFNMVGFSMSANGLASEQLYEPLGADLTKLTFTLIYSKHKPTIFELFKTYIAAYKVNSIFEKNLANIKRNIES